MIYTTRRTVIAAAAASVPAILQANCAAGPAAAAVASATPAADVGGSPIAERIAAHRRALAAESAAHDALEEAEHAFYVDFGEWWEQRPGPFEEYNWLAIPPRPDLTGVPMEEMAEALNEAIVRRQGEFGVIAARRRYAEASDAETAAAVAYLETPCRTAAEMALKLDYLQTELVRRQDEWRAEHVTALARASFAGPAV